MAVPVVAASATTLDEATGTTFTINLPGGVQSGDVLYAAVANDSSSSTYTTPTGWTAEGDLLGPTALCSLYLFSRRADGTEGASITSTCSGNRYKSAIVVRVTGVDSGVSDLTHQYAETEDTSTGTSHTSPGITTTTTDCIVLSAFLSDNTGVDSWAAAGSETEIADIQNTGLNGMALAMFSTDAAAAATYDHDVTQSPSGAACISFTWAIQSGAAASTSTYFQLLGIGG